MRCSRCQGFMVPETIFAEGYWIDQRRCINCGNVLFIRDPSELKSLTYERTTGRGRDNHKRQRYGVSALILQTPLDEWDMVTNKDMADRHGVSPTWISQLRRKCGKTKRYKSRGLTGLTG